MTAQEKGRPLWARFWGRAAHAQAGEAATALAPQGESGEKKKPVVISEQSPADVAASAFLARLKETFSDADMKPPPQADPETPVAWTVQDVRVFGQASLQQGAHLLAMREMLCALIALLPHDQRGRVDAAFRSGVEGILVKMENREVPQVFHDALLAEVNSYLKRLDATGRGTG